MSTSQQNSIEGHSVIRLQPRIVGITTPEFQTYANDTVQAIGRKTRRILRKTGAILVKVYAYLKRKLNEGAEMHNRLEAMKDQKYCQNFNYLRGIL